MSLKILKKIKMLSKLTNKKHYPNQCILSIYADLKSFVPFGSSDPKNKSL